MSKNVFSTVLLLFGVSRILLGQVPNVPTVKVETPQIVAEVNGDKITRSSLAAECLQLHGEDELQELVSRTLIRLECERQKITITAEEINAEVLKIARSLGMTSEKLLQLYEERRGTSPEQYRQDIIWRILALAKLAGPRLQISAAELKEAYDAEYGPAVQVRQIVLPSKNEAESVLAEVRQHPETFHAVAKNRSIDPATQPFGGMLRPIRRGSGDFSPDVEKILFAMKPGEISHVIESYAGFFSIFQCVEHLQPVDVDFNAVRQRLELKMRDSKLQQVAGDVFLELQKQAKVQIVFGNPTLYNQYPGVAAVINGQMVPQSELADSCIQKYGKEVLNDMMSRLLVEQACRRERIVITEQDIDNEIREMAFNHLPLKEDGSANVELWLERATEETGLSIPMYRKNIVVPVLSLKRLTRNLFEVTAEDVQRAFEANFGRKVRCLAIYLQDQRRAQEVWQKANGHKTETNFGDLAAEYSINPDTRMGRGVIPPIAQHCGLPELEKEAFSLKPGELSQIVQAEDYLVILYCLGYIEPLVVNVEDVKADLIADIFEKKQQGAIARYFAKLYEQAVLDNSLSGESQNPALEKALRGEKN